MNKKYSLVGMAVVIFALAIILAGCGGPTSTNEQPAKADTATHYEAENASLHGGSIGKDHAGYSGSGFWCYVMQQGTWAEFTVNVASGGSKNILCRYSNGGADGTMSIYVNGAKIRQVTFPSTKNWESWADKIDALTLNPGSNTIRYQYDAGDTGNINIDFIEIDAKAPASTP